MNDSKLSQNLFALSCSNVDIAQSVFLTKHFNMFVLLSTCSAIQRIAKL